MTTATQQAYTAKKWDLKGLQGISDNTLGVHFGLYEGYVTNTNKLNDQISALVQAGKGSAAEPAFAELTRRLGFEYNGMVLHEYYFDNLTSSGSAVPSSGKLVTAVNESFGDFETWKKSFAATGALRGVGWAILYQDPKSGRLSNHWVTLHEEGNVAGFTPILVMAVGEHAWLVDYKPAERPKYIEAFFSNVDWTAVEKRLK